MPKFFIERPVFAWVIAIFIVLAGGVSITLLPVSRFPSLAPPSISISANYTGASAETVNDGVVVPIERELTSVKNLLYFTSTADSSGGATITATFTAGTDPELAMVDVQNKLKSAEPRLPEAVRRNGLSVDAASSGFLMIVTLTSSDERFSGLDLSDYLSRNVVGELQRVKGVGNVQSFGTEKAMRIWVDPAKLEAFSLTLSDVTAAIQNQNLQIAPGQLGSSPTLPGQMVTVPLSVRGQLSTPEEFEQIVVKAELNGSTVQLRDVARVEIGAQSTAFSMTQNGNQATGAAIQMSPGANAVATADAVKARLTELQSTMPEGMTFSVPYDSSPFVKVSIDKVIYTLAEALALVFAVMFVFLHNIRYTLIPAVVAPIAILGTFAVMLLLGYSINVLTMFGLILAIGIIVDDAIVVVENVERIMATEGLPPKDATKKAMSQITGAIIGMTAVLVAVFIPLTFATGSVGAIYRQFAVSMAVSILFSAFLALSLTPALCATLLKPVDHGRKKWAPFALFDKAVGSVTKGYGGLVGGLISRAGRMMVLYAVLAGALVYWFPQVPSSFVPNEDQGSYMAAMILPADATTERTQKVVDRFNAAVGRRDATRDSVVIQGLGLFGSGQNAAMAFVSLKDWEQRADLPVDGEVGALMGELSDSVEGMTMLLAPPAIEELGSYSGFSFALQDRAGKGPAALQAAQDQLIAAAAQSSKLVGVFPNGLPSGPSVAIEIDRRKAQALGVPFEAISDTLTSAISSSYVNDFSNNGRLQQVIVQADARYRMQVDDVLKLFVRNEEGGMVALSEVVSAKWISTPAQIERHNGYMATTISGEAAPGVSSGEAMVEIERIAASLPAGFGIDWTGQSLQERQASNEMTTLLALAVLVVFLVLAALYESWTVPVAVLLVIPLGILGAVAAVALGGQANDVFFKVGLVTVIGLSAKNAILIVEFARTKLLEGWALKDAIVEAGKLRLRPIVMTSLAFGLGVLPLLLAHGASAETQRALGTGVFGGVIAATVLGLLFVPVFYRVVGSLFQRPAQEAQVKPAE